MAWKSTHPSLLQRLGDTANEPAWREFDRWYGELIVGYCRSCGLQPTDAEDIRQTVMLNLSKAMPKFVYDPQRGRFRSYLRRVVRNAIASQATKPDRKMAALNSAVLDRIGEDETDGADALWEQAWVRHHYRLALHTLRQSCEARTLAVFDRLVAGDTINQVAEVFDMSYDAVLRNRQRVRDRLRNIIADQVRGEEEWEPRDD